MTRDEYADATSAARAASVTYARDRATVEAIWQDDAAGATQPFLAAVGSGLDELTTALEEQAEAHERTDQLLELVGRQVDEVGQHLARVAGEREHAEQALRAADRSGEVVGSELLAGEAELRRALALAGQAGGGAAGTVGTGALDARVGAAVVEHRKQVVRRQVLRAVRDVGAVEAAWTLGSKAFERALGVQLPEGWENDVRRAVEDNGPVVAAHVSAAVQRLRDGWTR